ncbi:MAG: hypothetical protein PVJ57_14440 [Phycisphaerae bacterium]|jgi:hypothetical protein
MTIDEVKPGQRIRVIQEIDRREGNWQTEVAGVVESVGQEKTGSWYAHAKDDRLWLLRLRLRKDDGERTTITVDPLTRVELLGETSAS